MRGYEDLPSKFSRAHWTHAKFLKSANSPTLAAQADMSHTQATSRQQASLVTLNLATRRLPLTRLFFCCFGGPRVCCSALRLDSGSVCFQQVSRAVQTTFLHDSTTVKDSLPVRLVLIVGQPNQHSSSRPCAVCHAVRRQVHSQIDMG